MKKLLAMVLALVMTLSLAVSANAFTDDKSIGDDYAEAVAVLNGMGVFKGYEDGSFKPQGDITRAEVAAIVYRVYTADVKDAKASMYATYNKFSDMSGAGWAQGYIGYCANAELVKGYPDGTFKPSGKVTGYEVLAMILRAIGYDKNGEFSGADWALHVAQTAQLAGVLENVKGVDLNTAATRELVAELLFRAIAKAPMVTYTPAFGYVTDKVLNNTETTLGAKNFKLADKADSDDWGRPGTLWTYNVGDKSTFVGDKAVVSYETAVAECDIAKDLGISSAKKLEGAFIDGVDYSKDLTNAYVTTNKIATINPLATASKVGAQGRVTEVYDMGTAGYRLVEINTYLAQVTGITAAKTDKNGHTTDAYSSLRIYADAESAGVLQANNTALVADTVEFPVNSYVLVTVNKADLAADDGYVSSIEAAKSESVGALKGFTADTTIFGATYNDADKFVLNKGEVKTLYNDKVYDAYFDTYGNLIGVEESDSNYLVIEAIRWVDDTTVTGGAAKANVVLTDGTELTDVIVSYVGGKEVTNPDDGTGLVRNATVSDSKNLNTDYLNHLFTYSVDADGSYSIKLHGAAKDSTAKSATIYNGIVSFTDSTNVVVNTNNNTIFLVKDLLTGKYTKYEGKAAVPAMENATVCYLKATNGYASVVVVTDYKLATNTFIAYVKATPKTNDGMYVDGNWYYAYEAYKLGETTSTTIYAATGIGDTLFNGHNDGFYKISVDSNGIFYGGGVSDVVNEGSTSAKKVNGNTYVYTEVSINTLGGTLVTKVDNFGVSNAEIYTVTYDKGVTPSTMEIAKSSEEHALAGDKVYVVYNADSDTNEASYVYIVKNDDSEIGTDPETVATVTITGLSFDATNNEFVVGAKVDTDAKCTKYVWNITDANGKVVSDYTVTYNGYWRAAQGVYTEKVPYISSSVSGLLTVQLDIYNGTTLTGTGSGTFSVHG